VDHADLENVKIGAKRPMKPAALCVPDAVQRSPGDAKHRPVTLRR
jgi:hypothetical protein